MLGSGEMTVTNSGRDERTAPRPCIDRLQLVDSEPLTDCQHERIDVRPRDVGVRAELDGSTLVAFDGLLDQHPTFLGPTGELSSQPAAACVRRAHSDQGMPSPTTSHAVSRARPCSLFVMPATAESRCDRRRGATRRADPVSRTTARRPTPASESRIGSDRPVLRACAALL